jgi:maltooligosyltrehalose synthase
MAIQEQPGIVPPEEGELVLVGTEEEEVEGLEQSKEPETPESRRISRKVHAVILAVTTLLMTLPAYGTYLAEQGKKARDAAEQEAFDGFCREHRAQLKILFSAEPSVVQAAREQAKDPHERRALDRIIAAREVLDGE